MKIIVIFIFCTLVVCSCNKLAFYGDTFYTAKGRLVDTLGHPLSYVPLGIYNSLNFKSGNYIFGIDSTNDVISNNTQSDDSGRFQITFPQSNGYYYLMLPKGFLLDTVAPRFNDSTICRFYYLDTALFNNYLIDAHNIKVIKL